MTTLLLQVHRLRQELERLAEMFASLKNPLIGHMIARIDDLDSTVAALPTEHDALRWWLWHSQAHHIRNLMTPIQGYARLIHIQPSQLELTSYSSEQDAQFERVNTQANILNEMLTAYVDEMRSLYHAEAETPPQAMPLESALEPVWPILRYTLRDTAVVLVPEIESGLPSVLYHRLHTTALIQHLVSVMGRDWMAYGPLTLKSQSEADTMALRFAAPGLRVTDEQWEGLFKTAGDEVYYKRLTSIGGSLEQIISQGTQEGGLILHLPWAPTALDAAQAPEHPNGHTNL
jgi:hypothetical protein